MTGKIYYGKEREKGHLYIIIDNKIKNRVKEVAAKQYKTANFYTREALLEKLKRDEQTP